MTLGRPLFGRHARKVIAAFCLWEIVALAPRSPVPTISATVDRFPALGWGLLGMLGYHWFAEAREVVTDAVEAVTDAMADAVEAIQDATTSP